MSGIRTVEFEILRHGPSHNQLLSPLTQYLALCGNHDATTLRLPFEHGTFLADLRALRYEIHDGSLHEARISALARQTGEILGAVPGLLADLCSEGGTKLTHVELRFSAQELALLPFELANAPNGFPGDSGHLLLQREAPIVMTRSVRSQDTLSVRWPVSPRVLFAWSAPQGGIERDLVLGHIQALRHALAWHLREDDLNASFGRFVTVLDSASLRDIELACRSSGAGDTGGGFTHVHLLAHGGELPNGRGFGLAMHGPGGSTDIVDGTRLAAALRTHTNGGPASPTVVSLAACDAANQAQIMTSGASLAHTLHVQGIPFVMGSQFPLSKRGSVQMTNVLYEGLLQGRDPRWVVDDVRQSLRALSADTHDWASLVVYATFPPNLRDQMERVQTRYAQRAIAAAIEDARKRMTSGSPGDRNWVASAMRMVPTKDSELIWQSRDALTDRADALTRLGSAYKRTGQIIVDLEVKRGRTPTVLQFDEADRNLQKARSLYDRAYSMNSTEHWAGACLAGACRHLDRDDLDHEGHFSQLHMIRLLSEKDMVSDDHDTAGWAAGANLLVNLLALGDRVPNWPKVDLVAQARALMKRWGRTSQYLRSVHRELLCHMHWWRISNEHVRLATEIDLATSTPVPGGHVKELPLSEGSEGVPRVQRVDVAHHPRDVTHPPGEVTPPRPAGEVKPPRPSGDVTRPPGPGDVTRPPGA